MKNKEFLLKSFPSRYLSRMMGRPNATSNITRTDPTEFKNEENKTRNSPTKHKTISYKNGNQQY